METYLIEPKVCVSGQRDGADILAYGRCGEAAPLGRGNAGGVVVLPQQRMSLAKTTRPAISGVVDRPALEATLTNAAKSAAVWVGGPAGSGKTTLVASWLQNTQRPHLWYRFDANDVDAATFFHFLSSTAHKRTEAPTGSDEPQLPRFSANSGIQFELFARHYFRTLFARFQTSFALVLDNAQAVSAADWFPAAMCIAAEEVPKRGTIIITSRQEPAPALAALRASDALKTIGPKQLELDDLELAAIATLRGRPMPAEAIAQLRERTGGWAAAAVLICEHAKLGGELGGELGEELIGATPEIVFDYLSGEIFERFEAGTQSFLIDVACMPRMTAAAAEQLSGQAQAEHLLLNLVRNDYFVARTAAAAGEAVFEFHPLLREFLLTRFRERDGNDARLAHMCKAAAALESAHLREEAVEVLQDAQAWQALVELVLGGAHELSSQGRTLTLSRWIDALPANYVDSEPWLLYWQAFACMADNPREARRAYEQALAGFELAGEARGAALACCGVAETVMLVADDLALLDASMRKLDEHIETSATAPNSDQDRRRSLETRLLAGLYRGASSEALERWSAQLAAASRESIVDSERLRATSLHALALAVGGDPGRARHVLEHESGSTATAGEAPAAKALQLLVTTLVAVLGGRAEEAIEAAQRAASMSLAHGLSKQAVLAELGHAAGLLVKGELNASLERLDALNANQLGRLEFYLQSILRGWCADLCNDTLDMHQQYRAARDIARDAGFSLLEALARTAFARSLRGFDDERAARTELQRAQDHAQSTENPLLRVMCATASVAHLDGDQQPDALRSLMSTLRNLAVDYLPLWNAELMADLCTQALAANIELEYVRALVRTHDLHPKVAPSHIEEWPWALRIYCLGRFRLSHDRDPPDAAAQGRPLALLKLLVSMGDEMCGPNR